MATHHKSERKKRQIGIPRCALLSHMKEPRFPLKYTNLAPKNQMFMMCVISALTSKREREREMFYLTMHSTHFIYGYMASDIWLRTILIVRKETRCRHIGYSYRLARGIFYMHHPTDRITHTTAFVTPVVEHWLEREIYLEKVLRFKNINCQRFVCDTISRLS